MADKQEYEYDLVEKNAVVPTAGDILKRLGAGTPISSAGAYGECAGQAVTYTTVAYKQQESFNATGQLPEDDKGLGRVYTNKDLTGV